MTGSQSHLDIKSGIEEITFNLKVYQKRGFEKEGVTLLNKSSDRKFRQGLNPDIISLYVWVDIQSGYEYENPIDHYLFPGTLVSKPNSFSTVSSLFSMVLSESVNGFVNKRRSFGRTLTRTFMTKAIVSLLQLLQVRITKPPSPLWVKY